MLTEEKANSGINLLNRAETRTRHRKEQQTQGLRAETHPEARIQVSSQCDLGVSAYVESREQALEGVGNGRESGGN